MNKPYDNPARSVALPLWPSESPSAIEPACDGPPAPAARRGPRIDATGGDPFNPHKVLNHFDRLAAFARGELVYPITVEIDPSNLCNHKCHWCVSIESHTGEKLPLDRYEALLHELHALDTRSVVLKGGGEPTVHPHFNEMLAAATKLGIRVGVITNGSMPREGTRDAILEHAQWVRVSLDAADAQTHEAIHGSRDFEKVVDNIRYLAQHTTRTLIGLNFVAEQRNAQQIEPFARFARELGVAYVTIRCVFDPNHPPAERTRLLMREQAAQARLQETADFRVFLGNFSEEYLTADPAAPFPFKRCLGPNLIGVVGADGEVYACCFLRGNKQFSFGSIHEQSFGAIWRGDRRKRVMEAVYRGRCGYACVGGMTGNRYNTYNQILNYLTLEDKQHAEFA